jgi:large subunit ribosomal protein L29
MKRKDQLSNIKQLSDADLKAKIAEQKEALTKLKFNNTISQIDNPLRLRTSRKEIARMITELQARTKQAK